MKYLITYIIVFSLVLAQCKPKLDEFRPKQGGEVNFENYLAIGNSITAGFTNGALYKEGQEYSFSNIVAQQLTSVGRKGNFKQPILDFSNGISANLINNKLVLGTKFILKPTVNCIGTPGLAPQLIDPMPDQKELLGILTQNISDQGPFDNQAVPGMKLIDMFDKNFGQKNPFFGRIIKNPTSDNAVSIIREAKPSFFTCFVGNDDALLYAVSGGTSNFITPLEGDVGIGYKKSYLALIDTLKKAGNYKDQMTGAIFKIPELTLIPYFTTIPYNVLTIPRKGLADSLNAAYARYNFVMDSLKLNYKIQFQQGANPVVIEDPTIPLPESLKKFSFRQITSEEKLLLTLPTDSLLCANWGSTIPIKDVYTLRKSTLNEINSAIEQYNKVIEDIAQKENLALVDINKLLLSAATTGFTVDGIFFSSKFITGNLFSLDGVHLTPQGNAILAKEVIKTINEKYGSSIPYPPIGLYPGLKYP
ncbi:MAG: SGNH/GDSL hydrolase family protein [Bacteroidales bacterium]